MCSFSRVIQSAQKSSEYFAACKRPNILDKIENCDPIAHWGKQAVSIGCEEKISFAIYRPQEVGELRLSQNCGRKEAKT